MSPADAAAPIVVTLGEPAGVGPELAAALWTGRFDLAVPLFAAIGDPAVMKARAPDIAVHRIDDPSETAAAFSDALPILAVSGGAIPEPGTPIPETASSVVESIKSAVHWVQNGKARALVTLPIQKQILTSAGFPFAGHTDFLAHLAGIAGEESVMMLVNKFLRVVPVTHHIALAEVSQHLSTELIVKSARIVHKELVFRFAIAEPRLAVAGLNPHAGEGGRFGGEEEAIIAPAVQQLRQEINVAGPLPPDSLFIDLNRERYDAFICMYHDQALGPLKALDFRSGVNVTLGLPFVRTSPDHGTALDIAGKGEADLTSTLEAIKLADRLSRSPAID